MLLLGVGGLFAVFVASAQTTNDLTVKTLNVFPTHIHSDSWQNVPALYAQDTDKDALYQDFNKQGSAYIDLRIKNESASPLTPPSDSTLPTQVAPESTTSSESPPAPDTTPEVSPNETPPSSSDSGPVTLLASPLAFAGQEIASLFSRARGPLPLAVGEATVPDSPPVPDTTTGTPDTPPTDFSSASSQSTSSSADSVHDIVSTTTETVPVPSDGFCTIKEGCSTQSVTFEGFAIPELSSGEQIQEAQIRLSLGAKLKRGATDKKQGMLIEYSLDGVWNDAGVIPITDEVSNALNGGYFLFALPVIEDPHLLRHLKLRVTYRGDATALESLYLDSVWLELHELTLDETKLRERVSPEALTTLEKPKFHDFLGTKVDFTMEEMPQFTLKYHEQRNFLVRFFRSIFASNIADVAHVSLVHKDFGDIGVTPELHQTSDGLWTIHIPESEREKMKPGEYTLSIIVNEGSVSFTDEFQFQWGLLAVNTHKSEYVSGETATISLGALSPNGNTLCDANLSVYIFEPGGFIRPLPVARSGKCFGNNVTDVPDYTALYQTSATGTYTVYVESLDQNGRAIAHTEDTFDVVLDAPISIERMGPTRIYPVSPYSMSIKVSAKGAFKGELVEIIPGDFVATHTDATFRRNGDSQELVWPITFDGPGEQTFSYSLDAPDISPYLYLVGPASVHVTSGFVNYVPTPVLVSVATSSDTGMASTSTDTIENIPPPDTTFLPPDTSGGNSESTSLGTQSTEATSSGTSTIETPLTDTPPETTTEPAPAETSPAPAPTEDPTALPPPDSQPLMQSFFEGSDTPASSSPPLQLAPALVASSTDASSTPPETIETVSSTTSKQNGYSFTEKRRWQIASDATGSLLVYWTDGATIPSGWTCVSCVATSTFWQRFAMGGSVYGTTGGASTTAHTASATVYTSATANSENSANTTVSNQTHAHTMTPAIAATTTLPQFRQLRVIQNNSAGEPATVPAGAVMMFDSTLPTGWTRYSAEDGYYPWGQNTVGTTGGSTTHWHSVTGTTNAADASNLDSRTGGTQVTAAAAAHTHTISTSTTVVNNEPSYISVIFATSSLATSTPTGSLAMWTDTPPAGWLNRSAQAGDPFYNNFIKGSATYGTTGGATSHTHSDILSVTSSVPNTTAGARTGSTGSAGTHTHLMDVTSITTDSHLPPYVTVIFARRYGAVPLYTEQAYRWYVNANAEPPTDPWPTGAADLGQNEALTSTTTPVKNGDVVRLRVGLSVANSTSTSDTFKLQFGSTTVSSCSAIATWTDVGASTSSVEWRGYDNASVSDGATLSSSTLASTTQKQSYEENNPSTSTPNQMVVSDSGEWDFVLQQNGAYPASTYCFRMVKSDGSTLFAYPQYPQLYTNASPGAPTQSKLFHNEKVATTSPQFEFYAADNEADDISYEIQIDDDYAFGSINVDKDTVNNGSQFENLATPADKDPFTNGETIRFHLTSALTNGTTYYWKVRGKDPNGSNAWGTWSSIRSFTIDTTLTASAWFQTLKDQFSGDTLVGTIASTSNAITLATGSTTGTTTSPEIHFDWASTGNAWDSLVFSDSHPSGTVKYKFEYYASGVWAYIPDADLPGNSSGFGTTSVNLLSLSTDTYSIIRVSAIFPTSGGPPSVSDWTIKWGFKIPTPTITKLFPSEKTSTTTPTFEFTTTDPQADSLVYEVQWSTTYAFTASTTRTSSSSAGFVNITTATDTTPFNSGETIQFTVQAADAFTNGTTYWWRVRAIDPGGSNSWSANTTPQSFTVDTAVAVSTWFQTTQEQFATDILSGATSTTGGSVTVATTAVESLIAYAESTTQTPKYRTWNGTTWSAQGSALTVGATINWVVTRPGKTREEYLLGTLGTNGDVNVQVYKNGAWGNMQAITLTDPSPEARGFDMAYENSSGRAVAVACDGDADPTYYIWNGTSWTLGGTVNLVSTSNCAWIRMASNPTSNEIVLVGRDIAGGAYEAQVWNGSSWGNSTTLGSMNETTHEGMALAYEDSGNQAVVTVSNGTNNNFTWTAWNGTAWSAAATVALGDDFEIGNLASDVGTDNMALCYSDNDTDIGVARWTGAAFVATVEQNTAGNKSKIDRPVDCAFENGGARDGYIMVAYSTATAIQYNFWNGATWSTAANVSTLASAPTVQLRRTGANLLQLVTYDDTLNDYDYSDWNGTSWATLQTLESTGSQGASPWKEPFFIAARNPATSGSLVGSPNLDYDDGQGPYWKQLSWNDTESGGSTLLYQIEYYNTASSTWDLVPNSLIAGNSSGTTTSPINLSNLLPVASTYNQIRPVANFTCNLGTCPTLSDWTLTWAAGINISGTIKQYDQSASTTSGTVAVALNGTLQTGKTATISNGSWTIANVNARSGDVVTVFVTGAADANEAVGVTKYDGVGDISGMNLFERHVAIGSDDLATVNHNDMAYYDFTKTEDVFDDVTSSTTLTVCATTGCSDAELYVKAGNTYQPGGGTTITTPYFENNGTFLLNGNTMRVQRSWDNNATATLATSTLIFTATSTTETIDDTGGTTTYNTVTFGETSGTATWNIISNLTLAGDLTVTYGTFARATTSLTLAGNLTNNANGLWTGIGTTTFNGSVAATWTDNAATKQNSGKVVDDGTSKTVTLGSAVKSESITIGSDDILDASVTGYDMTVYSNWTNSNAFVARTGTVNFSATTTNKVITWGASSFYNLTFNGVGGSWSFASSTLTVSNNFTVSTGTVTLPTATTTVGGSWNSTGGLFAHNNGAVSFNATASGKTITLGGSAFTNAFYNLDFAGSGGAWSFADANATTSNNFTISAGTITLPSGILGLSGSLTNTGGTISPGSGTLQLTTAVTRTITTGGSSLASILVTGAGTTTFSDANLTATGNITLSAGTTTLSSGTLTLGGSFTNTAVFQNNSGTVLYNATTTGKTISPGSSAFYNVTFTSATGGWTMSANATTTNNFTLTSAGSFVSATGTTVAVRGTFTNSVGGASTTWYGGTLSLISQTAYSLNAKTDTSDVYGTLLVGSSTKVSMWNSSAATTTVDTTGYLYSEDNANVDGNLYIYGAYVRTTGTEYWSAATDFDGTAIATSSQRQVNVRFASGGTASFSSSTLAIVGTSTASTTIAALSGTYTLSMGSGTTTAQYYSFTGLGTTGFTMSSSTKVTSLGDGGYTVAAASGTALTISSTTIDANPALQIYRVSFATTTAILAANVTQNGGTPGSYWWFRNSTGNITGEAHDVDTGDPGSVRWDDSNLLITVAGVVYADDGVTVQGSSTCNGVTAVVTVVVNGGSSFTGACNSATGAYSIPNVVISGDSVLTVYLNTNGGVRATTITRTPTVSISNLNLYANRVITRHEDVAPLTIANMAIYDEDNDSDIRFNAATGTGDQLIVRSGTELHIASSTTFAPAGNVTIQGNGSTTVYDGSLHIDDNATLLSVGTTTFTIAGNLTIDPGATFTTASSSIVMNATTTGKQITASSTLTVNDMSFTGVGGGWSIGANVTAFGNITASTGTVAGTGNITLSYGSFSGNGSVILTGGTTTVVRTNTLGGSTPWTFANLSLGDSTAVGTTTPPSATTTITGVLTIATAHVLNAGSSQWYLQGTGTPFVVNGTFTYGTSLIRYGTQAATNITSTSYYNLDLNAGSGNPTYTAIGSGVNVLNDLTVGGVGTTTVDVNTNDPALSVGGAVTIRTLGVLQGSNSASFTVTGNWTNSGTYTPNSGTVTFTGATGATLTPGTSAFASAIVNKTGTFTVAAHATATAAFTLTAASTFTQNSGTALAVGGTFTNSVGGAATTWTGSTLSLYGGGNYQINASTTNESYATLLVASSTQIRMWNSSASTTTVDPRGSLYSQDNAAVDGALYIYGNYVKSSGTDYWSYATDFDGTALGGSSRAVTVSFAASATATYSGGTLNMIGASTASTTVQNQGSGTYGFLINAGTLNAQYYKVRNANASGTVMTGTPTITNLSYGDYQIGVTGGTGITVGGTVIDQNPALTFTGNAFATSSGVTSAFNVTATGTTVSSWRFTNHTGTLAGEAFDSDPGGDPGYIVWDNSSGAITISGNVYSDEGSTAIGSTTCDGSTQNVKLRVQGLTTYSTSCNAVTGAYSITGVTYSPGDAMIVYLDTNGGAQASTVTVDPVSSIANMHLYQNRLIVRHESATALTIAKLALWDSRSDSDILFTATTSPSNALTVPANKKLIVWTGKTFAPGGNVTLSGGGSGAAQDGTLQLYTNAVFTAAGGETHSIGGSLMSDSGASITGASATFTFTATSSARTVDTNNGTLYNMTFSGTGSWVFTDTALSIGNNFSISNGAVTMPVGTTTVAGSFLNTGGSFVHSTGTVYFTSTASGKTISTTVSSPFYRTVFNGSGGAWSFSTNATTTNEFLIQAGTVTLPSGFLSVGSQFNVTGGAVTHNSGTLTLTATTSSTTLRTNGSSLNSLTLNGTGSVVMQDTNETLLGNLSILQGTLTLATGTLSIGGSLTNTGGSFAHASGTILFNATATGKSISPGSSLFNNVQLSSATGGWTITQHATTTGLFSLTSASAFTLASSSTLTVYGVFTNTVGGASTTFTGSTLDIETGSNYTINTSSTGGDQYQTFIIGSTTQLRAWNSAASSTSITTSSGSFYSQNHNAVSGALYIFGNYSRTSGSDYWSYATNFDGTALGSPRVATTSFAANATATYSGGASLAIVGAAGATTTITNQGSGTYSLSLADGTFNGSYYALRNANANGLQLSGVTTITALGPADFELAVAGGTLITVSSTTVNTNSAATYSSFRFATTTAITGTNITLTGTTSSAWTFTAHTGNLAGEAYDVDGATACGSIRWSDSSCLITQETYFRWRNDDGGEGVPTSEWYNASWSRRKRIGITNADATGYVNAVVKVPVTYNSNMQSDFDDLRFTDASGTTLIPHWLEKYTASSDATVWVKVPLLATSTITSIYMYYGNGAVSDGSVGTTTFATFDNFETGNISGYSGDTSQFSASGASAYERTYRLIAADANGRTTDGIYNLSASTTVRQGQTIRYFEYIDTAAGSGDESCTTFGVQSPGSAHTNYGVCLELFGTDRVSISKNVYDNDTNGTVLASSTVTYVTGWHEVEIRWGTNNTIAVTVYRSGTVVATTSVTDSSYTSGGIGFTFWFQHGGWDTYTARPLLTTEPTVVTSVEQVSGGASWYAGLNSLASGITSSTTKRLRFSIDNSGLAITGQQLRLDFASKGASPSCEAVSSASYSAVPVLASCGTSPLCMSSSTNFSNLASTTDLLGNGTFTYGQIVKDTSNKTGSLSIGQSQFTEVEYAVVPTPNATSSSYCFRVSNNGTALDYYSKVAELGMRFDPHVLSWALNNGQNITLTPGATTTVYATGTVSDVNGYADLQYATATIYRSGVGASCTANDSNCYKVASTSCTFSNCSGNTCSVSCPAQIQFFADPTDAGTYIAQDWRADILISDQSAGHDTQSTIGSEMLTLRALSVSSAIPFGALDVNTDTGSYNATTTVQNIGNDSISTLVSGTDLTNGASSTIPVTGEKYATTTFTYGSCTTCTALSTSSTLLSLSVPKATTTSPLPSQNVFWGIFVPFGVAGTAHQGTNTFIVTGG